MTRWAITATAVSGLVTAVGFSTASASTAGVPRMAGVSIAVHPGTVTGTLPAGLVGLSLEASEFVHGGFRAGDLANYLKTLGPGGVLRVAGNSSDATFWTSTGERPPSWSLGTITPASLQSLATLAKASGWSVILGVNLKHKDPGRAADEARFARRVLGPALLAIEIGNEPNYYYTSPSRYFADFEVYAAAIRKAVPDVRLTGPDPGHNHPAFLAAFVGNESGHPDVAEVTNHHYPLSGCGGAHDTIAELLGTASVQGETAAATAIVNAARTLHVPAAMTETNSATCGGSRGVSDVFASALWALDYALLLAEAGVGTADFHGGLSSCGAYSPLCPAGTGLAAQPDFYGMLAVRLVGTGQFVAVTNPDTASLRVYAVKAANHLTVVLDNLQDPAHNPPATVTLNLGATFRQGQQTLLTTSAGAGLAARSGITLGGHPVAANGTFASPTTTPVTITGQSASLTVAGGTATIIEFA